MQIAMISVFWVQNCPNIHLQKTIKTGLLLNLDKYATKQSRAWAMWGVSWAALSDCCPYFSGCSPEELNNEYSSSLSAAAVATAASQLKVYLVSRFSSDLAAWRCTSSIAMHGERRAARNGEKWRCSNEKRRCIDDTMTRCANSSVNARLSPDPCCRTHAVFRLAEPCWAYNACTK